MSNLSNRPVGDPNENRYPAEIELPHAQLRRWRPADAEELAAVITANLDHLRPWMPWIAAEPMALSERLVLLQRWETEWDVGGDRHWAFVVDGRIAGSIGLMGRIGVGAVEMGYWLDARCTGRGIVTAAARAVTTVAFDNPRIQRVEIHHDKANRPSGAIPRRLGYEPVAERPEEITAPGESGTNCVWSMTAEAWAGRRVPVDP
jgi:ribosomal-protein-serine acetyltransferase